MRSVSEIEARAVEGYGPYADAQVGEVRLLARGLRRLHGALATLAERSDCGRSVRHAQRMLARDRLGLAHRHGGEMRPLTWIERALDGFDGRGAMVTPAELRALARQLRRWHGALQAIAAGSSCARSRSFAARVALAVAAQVVLD